MLLAPSDVNMLTCQFGDQVHGKMSYSSDFTC